MSTEIAKINNKMRNLVMFRGTKKEIIVELEKIGNRKDIILEPFEEPLPENDLSFNTNIGMIGDSYLDFEVYLLPTNKKDVFIVTEVTEF